MSELFVCYDDNGDILKITPEQPDISEKYILVDQEDVKVLLTGEELIFKWMVGFNLKTKVNELIPKGLYDERDFKINELIYEVPFGNKDAEIVIDYDKDNTCWKFLISSELEIFLYNNNISLNDSFLHFSVCEHNNPNILFKTLTVSLDQLVKNHYFILPFIYEWEANLKEFSIYTNKRFNTYSFMR